MKLILYGVIAMLLVSFAVCDKRLVLHSDQDIATELSSLKVRLSQQETQLGQVHTENQQLQTRLGHVETENQQLQSSLGQVQTQLGQIKTENKQLQSRLGQVESENQQLITTQSSLGGSVYVRWGRSVCPGNGSALVYKGYIGGSKWNAAGGGSNSLCLSTEPTWHVHNDGFQSWRGSVYGTEIDVDAAFSVPVSGYDFNQQDPPCAMCSTKRSQVLMIPGRANCYPGWTEEYSGYIMSGIPSQAGGDDYLCLDAKPEALPHGQTNDDEHILYYTEAHCGSLPCPPYHDGWELACVVCSK